MNEVYRLIPECIPTELHALIFMFAGTCTPSCKYLKEYLDNISNRAFIRFTRGADTLWCNQIKWNFPKYLSRNVTPLALKTHYLDLKIAYFQLRSNDDDDISEWTCMEINKVIKIQSNRFATDCRKDLLREVIMKK